MRRLATRGRRSRAGLRRRCECSRPRRAPRFAPHDVGRAFARIASADTIDTCSAPSPENAKIAYGSPSAASASHTTSSASFSTSTIRRCPETQLSVDALTSTSSATPSSRRPGRTSTYRRSSWQLRRAHRRRCDVLGDVEFGPPVCRVQCGRAADAAARNAYGPATPAGDDARVPACHPRRDRREAVDLAHDRARWPVRPRSDSPTPGMRCRAGLAWRDGVARAVRGRSSPARRISFA